MGQKKIEKPREKKSNISNPRKKKMKRVHSLTTVWFSYAMDVEYSPHILTEDEIFFERKKEEKRR